MPGFDTVLWDVDGTLLDFVYSQRIALTRCFQSIGLNISEEILERYREINDGFWKRLELGEISKEELLDGRFQVLFEEYGITGADVGAFRGEYQKHLGNVYKYIDNSLDICKALRGKLKQYVITNGVVSTQESKLKLSGFYDLMDGIFISELIGSPKPQRGFFEYCLREISGADASKCDKSRILIVGDSLTSDIKGGGLYQIPTCWYRPDNIFETNEGLRGIYEKYKPDYEISRLEDIFPILGTTDIGS